MRRMAALAASCVAVAIGLTAPLAAEIDAASWYRDLRSNAQALSFAVGRGDRDGIATATAVLGSIRRQASLRLLSAPNDAAAKACHSAADNLARAAEAASEGQEARFASLVATYSFYEGECARATPIRP